MEVIHIKEKNVNTTIYLDKEKFYGYRFCGNTIESINNLDILALFSLSKNYTKLSKYQKYEVYLDNETGLKHYFYSHNEDFQMLFLNNGTYAINYKENNSKISRNKIFNLKNRIIICTFLGLALALGGSQTIKINNIPLLISNYEPSDIKRMIYLSSNLTEEEKAYLYNEEFITDILSIINDSYYEKNKLLECFNSINIVGYNDIEHESNAGYYSMDNPNTLHIKNYEELNDKNKDTVAHEFAHLCQDIGQYNILTEASAEIIVHEYFSHNHSFCYQNPVKITKKLMEIIGSDPVWYYNFTSDFSKIEECILPYLSEKEYQMFLNNLSFNPDDIITNMTKYKELNELLDILYYRIYNKDIKENEIINLIEKEDKSLERYYFNQSMINEENSYYLDYDLGVYENLTYEEAIDRGIISVYTISYYEISPEAAFKIIEDGTYYLKRDINYHSHNINIQNSKHEIEKVTISGTIDGIKYEEVNIDDLAKEGLIDINYYIIDRRKLTSIDYHNHNYKDDEVYFVHEVYHTIINEDSVDYLVPKKIYLPTIKTRYNNQNQSIKKKKITFQ